MEATYAQRDRQGSTPPFHHGGDHVARLRQLLGSDAVLLPVRPGQKAPIDQQWPNFTSAVMNDANHLRRLGSGNIGVLLGEASGGLTTIDCDTDDAAGELLEFNPDLESTLQTKGARGRNFWLRIDGTYPNSAKIKRGGVDVGEWRANGNQTVIYGRHPKGCDYRMLVENTPINCAFSSINWPEAWEVPWRRTAFEELVAAEGPPLLGKGNKLNERFFAAKYKKEHEVVYDLKSHSFYQYDAATGLWRNMTEAHLKEELLRDMKLVADELGEPSIMEARTARTATALVSHLRGLTEMEEFFDSKPPAIHVANGMVVFDQGRPALRGFSPEYRSRNRSPIPYYESATCSCFLHNFLGNAFEEEDIPLLQKAIGQMLLGDNASQIVLLLTGAAGGGKSTIINVIKGLIGQENVAQLRTKHLESRFELAAFIGKTLLAGPDVPSDFLSHAGARTLKALVGGDHLEAEIKGVPERVQLKGNFNVVVSSNSRLRVKLEGDHKAWGRRLVVVPAAAPPPRSRIAKYDEVLLREEGAGILTWAVEGARLALSETAAHGGFVLSETQRHRTEDLIMESDSVRYFLEKMILPALGGALRIAELTTAYESFCAMRAWTPVSERIFQETLPQIMAEIHGAVRRNDLPGPTGDVRGYGGVRLAGQQSRAGSADGSDGLWELTA